MFYLHLQATLTIKRAFLLSVSRIYIDRQFVTTNASVPSFSLYRLLFSISVQTGLGTFLIMQRSINKNTQYLLFLSSARFSINVNYRLYILLRLFYKLKICCNSNQRRFSNTLRKTRLFLASLRFFKGPKSCPQLNRVLAASY